MVQPGTVCKIKTRMYRSVGTLLLERQSSLSSPSKTDFLLKKQELSSYSEFLPCCAGIKRRGKQRTVSGSTELKKTFKTNKKCQADNVPTYPSSLSSIPSVCWWVLSFGEGDLLGPLCSCQLG